MANIENPPNQLGAEANPPPGNAPPVGGRPVPVVRYLTPQNQLSLSRMDATWPIVEHAIAPAVQDAMCRLVYDQLREIRATNVTITFADFRRMWRTILLKRTQDVYERVFHRRPDHFIRMANSTMLPAPLADLVYNLGADRLAITGEIHTVVPPAHPNQPPNWWTLDPGVQNRWDQTMRSMERLYLQYEYPLPHDFENRTIMYATPNVYGANLVTVKTRYNVVRFSDGFLRAVHDPIFDPEPFAFADCHLTILSEQSLPGLKSGYVASYVLDSHA